jgi:hypothetical protein
MELKEYSAALADPQEQIERLVRQRNALWSLLENFSLRYGDAERDPDPNEVLRKAAADLWDQTAEIVGNTFVEEGINPATGDRLSPLPPLKALPYLRAAGVPWRR